MQSGGQGGISYAKINGWRALRNFLLERMFTTTMIIEDDSQSKQCLFAYTEYMQRDLHIRTRLYTFYTLELIHPFDYFELKLRACRFTGIGGRTTDKSPRVARSSRQNGFADE